MSAEGLKPGARSRQKRAQVIRACDFCRQQRIRCNYQIPCSNCRNRSVHCSNDAINALTLPEAYREIERLRQKVQELERELQNQRSENTQSLTQQPSPANTSIGPAPPSPHATTDFGTPQSFWKGIYVRVSRSPNETWYGPSSLFYFIGRVSSYLGSAPEKTASTDHMLDSNPACTLLDGCAPSSPVRPAEHRLSGRSPSHMMVAAGEVEYLSPTQEEYFLDLYWQSYHTSLFPILDEHDFKTHYRTLWTASGNGRRPSALVDMTIALSMQYGIAMAPETRQALAVDNKDDATVAGRWYYLRCQKLLAYEMESPSISTMQCQLLSIVYLCCATFHNMADGAYGLAVRTAYMLGLHVDPSPDMPLKDKELRKRLWWALYVLDSKIGLKLGRPFLVPSDRNDDLALPGDQLETALQSGSSFAPLGDNVTWLTFNRQQSRLYKAAREAHTAFYGRELASSAAKSIWSDPAVLEAHAIFLMPHMRVLDEWASSLPIPLRMKRQNNGASLSTDGSSLDIEIFAPLWLQRQRLLLELNYHHLCTNLYRPLISFVSNSSGGHAEEMAVKSARHAITLTNITHQVLLSTKILTGWHEAFQWQWNGAMTLVGFALAYPYHETAALARREIDNALAVFDMFGTSFAIGKSAAGVIRKLTVNVDLLLRQKRSLLLPPPGHIEAEGTVPTSTTAQRDYMAALWDTNFVSGKTGQGGTGLSDLTSASLQDVFDLAFDIDQCGSFDLVWPTTENLIPTG